VTRQHFSVNCRDLVRESINQQLFPLFRKKGGHQLYDLGGFCDEPDAIAFQIQRGFHLTAGFRDLAIHFD
jgi:hypothetical protein